MSDDTFRAGQATPIRATDKALLVDLEGEEVWLPMSVIHEDSEVWREGQEEGELVVKGWWADKQGWR